MVFIWQPQKEKLPVLGVRQVVVTRHRDTNHELDNDSTNTPTTTNQPCDKTIAPIRMQSNNQLIDELYVQLLSPPDARTVLLPKQCVQESASLPASLPRG